MTEKEVNNLTIFEKNVLNTFVQGGVSPNQAAEDAVILMDEIVDSLMLLDYENKFCKQK